MGKDVERNYKDTVFVTVFKKKKCLIELYNAIFDTNYDENTPLDIVTIKDVLFRTLKNDVAFTLGGCFVVLIEHQSTLSDNLPLRDLLYVSTLFKRMIDSKRLYRKKALMIPRPQFIVLYNGPTDMPEYQELRLSDAYLGELREGEEDALQLVVKVYNINSRKNAEILKKCETLRQYSRFVDIMRSYQKVDRLTNETMVEIMKRCQKDGILTDFFREYGTELIEMLFKELTREEDLEISRLDGYDAGLKEGEKSGFSKGVKDGFSKGEKSGFSKGEQKAALEIAKKLKKLGMSFDEITDATGLTMAEVNAL